MKSIVKPIQHKVIERLEALFKPLVGHFEIEYHQIKGVRGDYLDKDKTDIEVSFVNGDFLMEYYLCYDQLEYYVLKNDELIAKCVLEDYADMEAVMNQYVEYLERDIAKFNIPTAKDQS